MRHRFVRASRLLHEESRYGLLDGLISTLLGLKFLHAPETASTLPRHKQDDPEHENSRDDRGPPTQRRQRGFDSALAVYPQPHAVDKPVDGQERAYENSDVAGRS